MVDHSKLNAAEVYGGGAAVSVTREPQCSADVPRRVPNSKPFEREGAKTNYRVCLLTCLADSDRSAWCVIEKKKKKDFYFFIWIL